MSTTDEWDEREASTVGVVPIVGRESLPFALLHGESLVAVASWALGEAEVALLDFTSSWEHVQSLDCALVVHDPLCPATPVSFLRSAIAASSASGAVVVGVRPVTDTVKTIRSDVVGSTVDRSALVTVTSPLVLPTTVVAALTDWPDLADLAALVSDLRSAFPLTFLEAPTLGLRMADASDVQVLEAF